MKYLIQTSMLPICVVVIFLGGCTKLKNHDNQNSDENSVKAEADHDSGVIRIEAGRDAIGIIEIGKGVENSRVEDAETDNEPEIDSCEIPGQLRCDGFSQAQRSLCSETGFWIEFEPCADGELCDTQGQTSGDCSPVVPSCQGRNPGEAFCDRSDRVVCGPDLVDVESTACESIQYCQNGTGSDCAVCLSNSYSCEGSLLRKCKDDHTGYQDYLDCEETGEPCNEEAGACTSKACLEGQLRCNGDDLEKCNEDESSFELEKPCGEGLCDSDNFECDSCFSDISRCAEDGFTVITCSEDGLSESEQACPDETPFCIGAGRCVQCRDNTACDDGNPCTQNLCEQNTCSYSPVPNDCDGRVCGNSPSGCYQCGSCAANGERCNGGICETCNTTAYCGPSCSPCVSGSRAPVCGGATVGCICIDDSCGSESRCVEGSCADCVHECDEIGVSCSGSDLVTCEQNENGCRIREVQSCTGGATQCSGADTCGSGSCNLNHYASGHEGSPACNTCSDCNGSGSCAPVASGQQDVGCNEGVTSCSGADTCDGSGNCNLNNYASGTDCGVCRTCDGSGNCNQYYSDNTQDPSDCNGTCRACQGGSCEYADAGTDPGNDCTKTANGTHSKICYTGNCDDSGGCETTDALYCYRDADGDDYGDPNNHTRYCFACASGWVENDQDCMDTNPDVFESQTRYFSDDRGDGSFDYNCSGNEEGSPSHNLVGAGPCNECTRQPAQRYYPSASYPCGTEVPMIECVDPPNCTFESYDRLLSCH